MAQNKEDSGRGEENSELLINYDNIDAVEKQNILEKIVELRKKDNLPNLQNLRRIDKVRLKKKTKLVDEVIDSAQTSSITEDKKLVKCAALVIIQLLGIKEIKSKKKEEPFWMRRIESNINVFPKYVSPLKDGRQECWERKVRRQGFISSQKERV